MGMEVQGPATSGARKFTEPYFVIRFKDVDEGDSDDVIAVTATLDISPEFLGKTDIAEDMRDLLRRSLIEVANSI